MEEDVKMYEEAIKRAVRKVEKLVIAKNKQYNFSIFDIVDIGGVLLSPIERILVRMKEKFDRLEGMREMNYDVIYEQNIDIVGYGINLLAWYDIIDRGEENE